MKHYVLTIIEDDGEFTELRASNKGFLPNELIGFLESAKFDLLKQI
jgi:hypothetical protein